MKVLSNVDLAIIDCVNVSGAHSILSYCSSLIEFGNVYLFTDQEFEVSAGIKLVKIPRISNLSEYSDFCLRLGNYCFNDYLLLVQCDGFILNSDLWDDSFLDYDYLGAPWVCEGNRIGNGGFSLRSRKYLDYSSKFDNCGGVAEDFYLNNVNYSSALDFGINYPSGVFASKFSVEHRISGITPDRFFVSNHFGFHGRHMVSKVMSQRADLFELLKVVGY